MKSPYDPSTLCKRAIYNYTTTTNVGSLISLHGVKVRVRSWFKTRTALTDGRGNFRTSSFKNKVNYSIKWKRYEFSIRWSALYTAKYNGPKIKGDWNLNIRGGTQEYYATIFRAAHHYYYKDIKGLRRPPQNGFWNTQMKIRAYNQNVSDEGSLGTHNSFWQAFGLRNPIKIYTYQRPNIETYATTIHELAHASHWNMDRSDFSDSENKVIESWARGVQWELGRMTYANYLGRERSVGDYTLVVSDMIDDDFITTQPMTNQGFYIDTRDQVSGYTIKQIEDALKGQKNWNNWRDNIINRYNNPSEDQLTRLFSAYE